MPLTPPLCLRAFFTNTASSGNDHTTILSTQPQTYTSGGVQAQYNGTNVAVGMYATSNLYGMLFRIKSISSQTSSSVTAVLEDIGGLNKSINVEGDGNGAPYTGWGYIFELNNDGLPALTAVNDPPTITFPDSILGRFMYDKQPPLTENFCVAGGTGTNALATTHDGKTWTPRTISFLTSVRGVAWNGSLWVAVGDGGGTSSIGYSSDGINWTAATNVFSTGGRGVAWNGTMWVAVGSGTNTMAYSMDGITWTVNAGTPFASIGFDLEWNGILWVAVGAGGVIATSSDGLTWKSATSPFTSNVLRVAWNGTRWVAVGTGTHSIAYSPDGINWTGLGTSIFSISGFDVAWNGTRWVAVGQGTNTIAYSANGISWTGVGTSIFSTSGRGVAWNGARWIAVGHGTNTLASSTDGITWTGEGSLLFSTLGFCVASREVLPYNKTTSIFPVVAENFCVAGGEGYIAYSYDTKSWTICNSTLFINVNGIAWNGSIWVAVGLGAADRIATSPDGINWTGRGGITGLFTSNASSVAWNGSLWVAVGSGTHTIATSPDGITWTGRNTGDMLTSAVAVVWTGKLWVVGGQSADLSYSIIISTDGITWTKVTSSSAVTVVSGLACSGSLIVATGYGLFSGADCIMTSSTGSSWISRGGGDIFENGVSRVAYNGSSFVAVGSGSAHSIAVSSNGTSWSGVGAVDLFGDGGIDITWNGSVWVAVGYGTYTIVTSPDGSTWTGQAGISTLGTVGRSIASRNVLPNIGKELVPNTGYLKINNQATLNPVLEFNRSGTTFGASSTSDWRTQITSTGENYQLVRANITNTITPFHVNGSNGRVGIGTTGPGCKLQVIDTPATSSLGTPSASTHLSVLDTVTANGTDSVLAEIGSHSRVVGNYDAIYKYQLGFQGSGTTGGGNFVINAVPVASNTYNSDGTTVNRLTITPTGNVGINAIGNSPYDTPFTGLQVGTPASNAYNASYNTSSNVSFINQTGFNVQDNATGNVGDHKANLWLYTDLAFDSGTNSAGAIAFGARNQFAGYRVAYSRISGVRLGNFYGGLSIATMHNLNDGVLRENVRIYNGQVDVTGNLLANNAENIQYITTNSTVSIPSGYTKAHITLVGAGGGGGGQSGTNPGGGGGGGAGWVVEQLLTTLSTMTITIGTGGAGSATGVGGAGGSSTIVLTDPGTIIAPGGSGGQPNNGVSGGAGGAGYYGGGGGGGGSSGAFGPGGVGIILSGSAGTAGTAGNGGAGGSGGANNRGGAAFFGSGGGGSGGGPAGGAATGATAPTGGPGCGGGGRAAGLATTAGSGGNGYAIIRFLR